MSTIDLSSILLFSRLSKEQLTHLESVSVIRSYGRGSMIFHEGDAANGLYIVTDGMVKIYRQNAEGREAVLHVLRTGHMFAEVPVFQGGNFPASAQAVEESTVLILPRDKFLQALREDPALALRMLAAFSQRMKELVDRVEGLAIMEASQRLASYLLYLAEQADDAVGGTEAQTGIAAQPTVELDISRSLLAGMLGSARETLSRVLTRLDEAGAIKLDGRNVRILDEAYLKALAKGLEKL